jgi:hypothetical protein
MSRIKQLLAEFCKQKPFAESVAFDAWYKTAASTKTRLNTHFFPTTLQNVPGSGPTNILPTIFHTTRFRLHKNFLQTT